MPARRLVVRLGTVSNIIGHNKAIKKNLRVAVAYETDVRMQSLQNPLRTEKSILIIMEIDWSHLGGGSYVDWHVAFTHKTRQEAPFY